MKPQSFAVLEPPPIASSSVENSIEDLEKRLLRPSAVKLEAFTLRLAWGFASVVLLLTVASLLLAVAGYAGSILAPDLQPKSVSSSRAR